MSEVTLFGFPRSVYVQMAGIVLTHKEVQYTFHDLETEMNTPGHIALHPFERVPILGMAILRFMRPAPLSAMWTTRSTARI
jgi:glutathione S-transferase